MKLKEREEKVKESMTPQLQHHPQNLKITFYLLLIKKLHQNHFSSSLGHLC